MHRAGPLPWPRRAVAALKTAEESVSTGLELVGAGLVTAGVALIYVPAGFITGGLLAMGLGYLLGRPAVKP